VKVEANIAAVASENPPLRLVRGKYANDKVRIKLAATANELAAWEHIGLPTLRRAAPQAFIVSALAAHQRLARAKDAALWEAKSGDLAPLWGPRHRDGDFRRSME